MTDNNSNDIEPGYKANNVDNIKQNTKAKNTNNTLAKSNSTVPIKPLDVAAMELSGRHIIEASAGTGKTYNITRIVIRLLLERQVELKNILIVTFTKAATEELKGRIAKEINQLLNYLEHCPEKIESLFTTFINRISLEANQNTQDTSLDDAVMDNKVVNNARLQRARLILKQASLSLDEASIFTIHSFCQRVLKQTAFMRQKSFTFDLINQSEPYYIQAIQDFFRRNAHNETVLNALEFLKIKSPNEMYSYFYNAFESSDIVECPLVDSDNDVLIEDPTPTSLMAISEHFWALKQNAISQFFEDQATDIGFFNDFIANNEKRFRDSIKANSKLGSIEKQQHDLSLAIVFLKRESVEKLPSKTALATVFQQKKLQACFANKTEATRLSEATKSILQGLEKLHKNIKAHESSRKTHLEDIRLKLQTKHFQLLVDCVKTIKADAANAKKKREVIDHNDTIIELCKAVKSGSENVINYIQESFPYALIDEFQDTDNMQYSIFSKCYPSRGNNLLLMIGDPKQAIYAFRGSDINTYISARDEADFIWSMQSNYRSSLSMINAYNTLFSSSKSLFGDLIDYPWIDKGEGKDLLPFNDPQSGAICFQINSELWPTSKGNKQYKEEQAYVVANEIIRLFQQAKIDGANVQPKDIAILIPGKNEAKIIKDVLDRCNIPSVFLSEKSNVFQSEEALLMLYALDGILHLNDNRKFVRALSSELFGLNVEDLLNVQSDIVMFDELKLLFAQLKQCWLKDGVLVMLTQLLKTHFKSNRLNASKERILTNYNHLAELLNEQSKVSEHAYQLLTWFKKQIPNDGVDTEEQQETENEQRLESDEALVKLVTLHGSKGLEYPIVFIPYAGFVKSSCKQPLVKYYDKERKKNVISVGETIAIKELAERQVFEEEMRLLYVGITRAIYKCYLGIGKPTSFANSPLAKIIANQQAEHELAHETIDLMALKQSNLFSTSLFNNDIQPQSNTMESQNLEVISSTFKGNTSQLWQLASFSYIAKQTTHSENMSFIDMNKKERDEQAIIPEQGDSCDKSLDYRFTMQKSADTGTLLHNLLEDHDFTQELIISDDNTHIGVYQNELRECNKQALEVWLNDVLSTPIPTFHQSDTFKLANLNKTQVLKEPEFYFPINRCNAEQLNKLINTHRKARDAYNHDTKLVTISHVNSLIAELTVSELSGMMHGFIDLLFEYDGKYYVADYKSNYLGDKPSDYLGVALQQSVQSHLYDLQYLIYTWALDRYLKQRLPNYDRDMHFGGVYYFFLRGMSAVYPPGNGIYSAQIDEITWGLLDNVLGKSQQEVDI